jgi:hypothetical protein
MGAVSSATSKSFNEIVNVMTQECSNQTGLTQQCGGNIKLVNCNNFNYECENTGVVSFGCSADQVSKAVQKATSKAVATASAGLWGIAASYSMSESDNITEQYLSQRCDSAQTVLQNISVPVDCLNSDAVTIRNINRFNAKTKCFLKQASDLTQTADSEADAIAKAWDPIGELMIVIWVFLGIFVLLVCVKAFTSIKGGKSQSQPKAAKVDKELKGAITSAPASTPASAPASTLTPTTPSIQ